MVEDGQRLVKSRHRQLLLPILLPLDGSCQLVLQSVGPRREIRYLPCSVETLQGLQPARPFARQRLIRQVSHSLKDWVHRNTGAIGLGSVGHTN
jgi:hypothetical protein